MYFGRNTKLLMKNWIEVNYHLIKKELQIWFIRRCLRLQLLPNHVNNIAKNTPLMHHFSNFVRMRNALTFFKIKIMKLELNDAYKQRNIYNKTVINISKDLNRILPLNICSTFYCTQDIKFKKFYKQNQSRLQTKITTLLHKQRQNIDPIEYHAKDIEIDPKKSISNNHRKISFHQLQRYSLNPFVDSGAHKVTTISVSPKEFYNIDPPKFKTNDKWFINLSGSQIPQHVTELLQLGENFTLPSRHKKDLNVLETIKDIENCIRRDNISIKSSIRNRVVSCLDGFLQAKQPLSRTENELIIRSRRVFEFVKDNPDIIFTRADKGNTTVALNKRRYVDTIKQMLSDTNTYEVVKNNPLKKIEGTLNEFLKRWVNKGFINTSTKNWLKSSDGILPRIYGVPKIHKINHPYRLIVSSIDSPLHNFACYLHKVLYESIPYSPFYVKDSFHLHDMVSDLKLNTDQILCSFDAVSLFTNIPIELAIEGVEKRWRYINIHTKIEKNEFISALKFVLTSTYFVFDNSIYKQTFGTPMGSPLSPIIADITLQDLELKALNRFSLKYSLKLPLYLRYVDDILLIIPKNLVTVLLNIFNSFHSRLQFTFELEIDRCLSFLDIKLMVQNNVIICDWFQKPTASDRYLNFLSQNPTCHKIGTMYTLIDRAILLSHYQFQEKNIRRVINILLINNYPLQLIFQTINKRLKFLIANKLNNNNAIKTMDHVGADSRFLAIPFIPTIMHNFKTILNDQVKNVKLGFRNLIQLNSFIRTHKDRVPPFEQKNVVYCVQCNNCNSTYVGQTSRHLQTRIKEHQRNVSNNKQQISVIAEHAISKGHTFNWQNVRILDRVPSYNKRLVSEMLHIKLQKNSINVMQDTEALDNMYLPIIDKLQYLG